jgi:hypothetical protein
MSKRAKRIDLVWLNLSATSLHIINNSFNVLRIIQNLIAQNSMEMLIRAAADVNPGCSPQRCTADHRCFPLISALLSHSKTSLGRFFAFGNCDYEKDDTAHVSV